MAVKEVKLARKCLQTYINAKLSDGEVDSYVKLGKDLEELTYSMNPEEETKANILGESSTNIKSYSVEADVGTYVAEDGSPLFTKLQKIVDARDTTNEIMTDEVEVHFWKVSTKNPDVFEAYKEDARILVQSYGGDTTGYQIPFNLKLVGNRTLGWFDITTNTFTTTEPVAKE